MTAFPVESRPTVDDAIDAAVAAAVERHLRPILETLNRPAKLTYSVPEAAHAMGVGERVVWQWLRDGVLPRVPNLPGRTLIPRRAVEDYVRSGGAT